jgi:hypothetical protein
MTLTTRSIWSDGILRRRFRGCLDPLLAVDLFRPFLQKFVLTTIDATCHSRARLDLELARRFDTGASTFFQISGCS